MFIANLSGPYVEGFRGEAGGLIDAGSNARPEAPNTHTHTHESLNHVPLSLHPDLTAPRPDCIQATSVLFPESSKPMNPLLVECMHASGRRFMKSLLPATTGLAQAS